jgi:hypothetical protein
MISCKAASLTGQNSVLRTISSVAVRTGSTSKRLIAAENVRYMLM